MSRFAHLTFALSFACIYSLGAQAQTLASYTGGASGLTSNTMSTGTQQYKASAFTVGSSDVSVSAVDFFSNTGVNSVNYSVSLWSATYTAPTIGQQTLVGSPLGTVTVSASGQSALTLETATFASAVTLSANQTYMLVIGYSPVTGTSTTIGTTVFSGNMTGSGVTPLTGLFRDATGTAGVLDGAVSSTNSLAYNLVGTTTAVPEPATYAMVAGALALALAAYRRRRA